MEMKYQHLPDWIEAAADVCCDPVYGLMREEGEDIPDECLELSVQQQIVLNDKLSNGGFESEDIRPCEKVISTVFTRSVAALKRSNVPLDKAVERLVKMGMDYDEALDALIS